MPPQLEVLISVVLFLGLVFWVGKGIELGKDAYHRAVQRHRDVGTWTRALQERGTVNYRRVEYERYLEQATAGRDRAIHDFAIAFVWPLAALVSGIRATVEVVRVARARRKEGV